MQTRAMPLVAALALGLSFQAPAVAGEVATDDFMKILTKQALNLGKPRSLLAQDSTLGTGRGLVLAPTEVVTEDTPVTEVTDTAYVTYTELPEDLQLNIQISFDFDSAALRSDETPKLAALCEAMLGVEIETFQIVGHTDAQGEPGYNEQLSLLRAEEVKRHLVGDCGIEAERLQAVGVGEAFPADDTNPDADINRRVEFQALS